MSSAPLSVGFSIHIVADRPAFPAPDGSVGHDEAGVWYNEPDPSSCCVYFSLTLGVPPLPYDGCVSVRMELRNEVGVDLVGDTYAGDKLFLRTSSADVKNPFVPYTGQSVATVKYGANIPRAYTTAMCLRFTATSKSLHTTILPVFTAYGFEKNSVMAGGYEKQATVVGPPTPFPWKIRIFRNFSSMVLKNVVPPHTPTRNNNKRKRTCRVDNREDNLIERITLLEQLVADLWTSVRAVPTFVNAAVRATEQRSVVCQDMELGKDLESLGDLDVLLQTDIPLPQ